jgi:predicted membrane-bound spermidine synthase
VASDPSEARLAGLVPLLGLCLLGAAHELAFRQVDAYLGPGLSTPRWVATTLSLVGLLLGGYWGRRALLRSRRRLALLVSLGAALSISCSASGALWFWAFQQPAALALLACALPLSGALLAGAALAALLTGVGLAYRELGSLRFLLAPAPLGLALLLALGAAVALSYVGLWRAGAAFGLALSTLSLVTRRFGAYFSDPVPVPGGPARAALGGALLSLVLAQAYVPARLLGRYPAEVVWTSGEASELVVVSAQNTFELFEVEQLRLTSADAYRLAELAVHPALAFGERRRVLLLGPAGGLFEREVLRHPEVAELWSVSEQDSASFRDSAWPRAVGGVSREPRVHFVVAEPMPWLEGQTEPFDAAVVSLPLPTDYAAGKHYTRFFYELLAAKLAPAGVLVVQAASRAVMPASFATIQSSLKAAGWTTTTYEAPVPLLGAVSFLLASRQPLRFSAVALPPGLRFVDPTTFERSLTLGVGAEARAPISTLDAQHAVELWHEEQTRLGN